jgi:DNA-binding PadR family transcriptional regulator
MALSITAKRPRKSRTPDTASRPRARDLTTPDLVLLSLLSERPMHGYEANAELERRRVRDWAGISRPQVYYSLEKLVRLRLVRATGAGEPSGGPERRVLATTPAGAKALADALEAVRWTTRRDQPPFLTWMALSWRARPGVAVRQLERRRLFLQTELAREQATLRGVRREVGHPFHEAVWMLTLTIRQLRLELAWVRKVGGELERRAPAEDESFQADRESKQR